MSTNQSFNIVAHYNWIQSRSFKNKILVSFHHNNVDKIELNKIKFAVYVFLSSLNYHHPLRVKAVIEKDSDKNIYIFFKECESLFIKLELLKNYNFIEKNTNCLNVKLGNFFVYNIKCNVFVKRENKEYLICNLTTNYNESEYFLLFDSFCESKPNQIDHYLVLDQNNNFQTIPFDNGEKNYVNLFLINKNYLNKNCFSEKNLLIAFDDDSVNCFINNIHEYSSISNLKINKKFFLTLFLRLYEKFPLFFNLNDFSLDFFIRKDLIDQISENCFAKIFNKNFENSFQKIPSIDECFSSIFLSGKSDGGTKWYNVDDALIAYCLWAAVNYSTDELSTEKNGEQCDFDEFYSNFENWLRKNTFVLEDQKYASSLLINQDWINLNSCCVQSIRLIIKFLSNEFLNKKRKNNLNQFAIRNKFMENIYYSDQGIIKLKTKFESIIANRTVTGLIESISFDSWLNEFFISVIENSSYVRIRCSKKFKSAMDAQNFMKLYQIKKGDLVKIKFSNSNFINSISLFPLIMITVDVETVERVDAC